MRGRPKKARDVESWLGSPAAPTRNGQIFAAWVRQLMLASKTETLTHRVIGAATKAVAQQFSLSARQIRNIAHEGVEAYNSKYEEGCSAGLREGYLQGCRRERSKKPTSLPSAW